MQQLRDGSIETGAQDHRVMAAAIGAMAYIQLLELDIGGQEEFLSTKLKEVHDPDANPAALNPDQFMRILSDQWRAKLLSETLGEVEGGGEEAPEWLWLEEEALELGE
jgi:hypothetical protein